VERQQKAVERQCDLPASPAFSLGVFGMVTSEKEMVRPLVETLVAEREEKFTSLQPTYEDSVPPVAAEDWEYGDE
jgi:hypothetical protein